MLVWEGYLTGMERMAITDLNISDIPRDQIEKLASIVTRMVLIVNMTHADQLGSILASVKCPVLWLKNMRLSEAETQALVTAMRDQVEIVTLRGDVTLDIEELTQYDGQGHCSGIWLVGDTRTRHRDRLRRWAADKGWTVTRDKVLGLGLLKKKMRVVDILNQCAEAAVIRTNQLSLK